VIAALRLLILSAAPEYAACSAAAQVEIHAGCESAQGPLQLRALYSRCPKTPADYRRLPPRAGWTGSRERQWPKEPDRRLVFIGYWDSAEHPHEYVRTGGLRSTLWHANDRISTGNAIEAALGQPGVKIRVLSHCASSFGDRVKKWWT